MYMFFISMTFISISGSDLEVILHVDKLPLYFLCSFCWYFYKIVWWFYFNEISNSCFCQPPCLPQPPRLLTLEIFANLPVYYTLSVYYFDRNLPASRLFHPPLLFETREYISRYTWTSMNHDFESTFVDEK